LGEIPEFQIVQPEAPHWNISSLCVSSHIHFILVELLKNAAKASFENTMKDFDSLEADTLPTLPPVRISAAVSGSYWSLKISDSGGGMEYDSEKNCMQWYRSATKTKTPTYTYGGDFGPQLSGLGVGLPTSQLYCRFMGGDLRLLTQYGAGTDVVIHWNRFGSSEMPNN
jgi:signal transduction histidine kinase